MEIGVLFSTAYAGIVRRSPARMHKDTCTTHQLHCQWCSGRRYPRILRWQIFLRGFDYTIQVIRGADNGLADFLSRNGVE